MTTRSPIVVTMGHVDHGKTSLLDAIRGSSVAKKEAGAITQMIGASYLDYESISFLCKKMTDKTKTQIKIPGLLFIDTPGHAAFTNLRERGGSIADIAILVVDIAQGFQPQTVESLRILKQYKTPFIIAANKLDLIKGWHAQKTTCLSESLSKQTELTQQALDEKLYEVMGKISEFGFDSERFDRVTDFTKQICIVPMSAKTKEGIADLIMILSGISQKFLEDSLRIEVSGPGKGSIIEVKEEKGMGTTVDVILYDGVMKRGEEVIFLTKNGAKTTKIRGLLEPNISPKKAEDKYNAVEEVYAAAGVKVLAPGLEDAIPGSPINVVVDFEKDKSQIEEHFKQIIFEREENGVILKAESLGSVEALVRLFSEKEIPIKEASIGTITKRDILAQNLIREREKFLGVVFGFNVQVMEDARVESEATGVPIIWSNIIYRLLDEYEEWRAQEKIKEEKSFNENFPWPSKIKVLPGCCFRVSKPAIFGIEVLSGKLKVGDRLMNTNGDIISEVKEIQDKKENIKEAKKGMQIAISCPDVLYGKDISEGDVLYTYIEKRYFEVWEKKLDLLSDEEKDILNKIRNIVIKPLF